MRIFAAVLMASIVSTAAVGQAAEPARPANSPAAVVVRAGAGAAIDEFLQRCACFGFSGSVLVSTPDGVVLCKGYGLADAATGISAAPDTAYGISSLDKPMVAAGILLLKNDGKLALDDSIAKHLRDCPEDKAGITVAQLLSHTSGLSDHYRDAYADLDFDAYVRQVLSEPLEAQPGARFGYSNSGHDVLVALIQRVSGQPLEAFLRHRLLLPAGMTATGERLVEWRPGQRAVYADSPRERWRLAGAADDPRDPYLSFLSTVGDIDRFLDGIGAARALPRADVDLMLAEQQDGYALGWRVGTTDRGTRYFEHGGIDTAAGCWCLARAYPDEHIRVVAMGNTLLQRTFQRSEVIDGVMAIVRGGPGAAPSGPPACATAPEAAAIQQLIGRYRLPGAGSVALVSDAPAGVIARTSDPAAALVLTFPGALGHGLEWGGDGALRGALEKLFHGDAAPLIEILPKSPESERIVAEAGEWASRRVREFGALRRLRLLHRAPLGSTASRLWLAADLERSTQLLRVVTWKDGVDVAPTDLPEEVSVRYRSTAGGAWSGWLFATGSGGSFRPTPADSGARATAITFVGAGTEVVAERESD